MWIKEHVEELIEECDTNDPYGIAEAKKIHVISMDLHAEIFGYYKYMRRNRYIVINSGLSDTYQRFVCAHELGHVRLHPRIDTPFMKNNTLLSVDKVEREANRFAVELLMPDSVLNSISCTRLTNQEAGKIFGVPDEVCELKKFD